MAKHIDTGKLGEAMAVQWIKDHGFEVLHVNWRFSHYEIDIIASKDHVLHFIEVKTRNSISFGLPEEDVSRKKLQNVMSGAEEFLVQNPGWKWIQYDILAITTRRNEPVEFFLIEDVYDASPD